MPADEGDPRREKTREFFQLLGPSDPDEAGSVLTGWVVVQEWMNPAGEKFLIRGWDQACALWSVKGMMHEVLYGDWPTDEEADDEDE
jgi:hypothetical protein